MPMLEDPRHETFARARAKGMRLEDAYEDAGFAPGNRHAARLARRPEIAARIAELRAEQTHLEESGPAGVIGALLGFTRDLEKADDPAVLREARLTLVEVARLRREWEITRSTDRIDIRSADSTYG